MMGSSIVSAITRWFRGPRALLGALALVIITPLVGGLLVWAYWNPPANTNALPAAIVNEDTPATVNGRTVDAGGEMVKKLTSSNTLQWQSTSMDQARQGLSNGTYSLVVRVPPGFSQQVASLDSGTPQQAQLDAYTNDAVNYMAGHMAADAMVGLEQQAGANLSLNFIDSVYAALPQAKAQGDSAVAGAKALSDGLGQASQQAQQVAASTKQVADGTAAAATAVTNAANSAKALPTSAATVATSAQNISALGSTISTGAKTIDTGLANVQQQLTSQGDVDIANTISNLRQQFAGTVTKPAGDVATASAALGTQARQLGTDAQAITTSLTGVNGQLTELSNTAKTSADGAAALSKQLTETLLPQSQELYNGLQAAASKVPPVSEEQRDAFTKVLAQPVQIVDHRDNEVQSMGEGFAPLFVPTALFVGAMVIFLLMQAINRRLLATGFASWRAVASRWVPAVAWAMAQVIVLLLVLLGLGVRAVTWGPTLGIMILTGVCFVSMAQFVRAALGGGGQFVLMGLLALQLTATAGTYPVQTLNGFFQALHPFMPMTYAADGIRRGIAGGPISPYLWIDAGVLLAVSVACVGATVYVATYKRRLSAASMQPAIALN